MAARNLTAPHHLPVSGDLEQLGDGMFEPFAVAAAPRDRPARASAARPRPRSGRPGPPRHIYAAALIEQWGGRGLKARSSFWPWTSRGGGRTAARGPRRTGRDQRAASSSARTMRRTTIGSSARGQALSRSNRARSDRRAVDGDRERRLPPDGRGRLSARAPSASRERQQDRRAGPVRRRTPRPGPNRGRDFVGRRRGLRARAA